MSEMDSDNRERLLPAINAFQRAGEVASIQLKAGPPLTGHSDGTKLFSMPPARVELKI